MHAVFILIHAVHVVVVDMISRDAAERRGERDDHQAGLAAKTRWNC